MCVDTHNSWIGSSNYLALTMKASVALSLVLAITSAWYGEPLTPRICFPWPPSDNENQHNASTKRWATPPFPPPMWNFDRLVAALLPLLIPFHIPPSTVMIWHHHQVEFQAHLQPQEDREHPESIMFIAVYLFIYLCTYLWICISMYLCILLKTSTLPGGRFYLFFCSASYLYRWIPPPPPPHLFIISSHCFAKKRCKQSNFK